jgi:hypothetical protein
MKMKFLYWTRNSIIVAKTQKSMLILRLLIDAPKQKKKRGGRAKLPQTEAVDE